MQTSFSSKTFLLATIPYGIFGIAWAVSNSGLGIAGYIQSALLAVSVLAVFIAMGIGWIKNFPRWSFPAVGACKFLSLFFLIMAIFSSSSRLAGLWALLLLAITIVICLIFTKFKFEPIKQLLKRIKEEPELILFALYGFAPYFVWLLYDEMKAVWLIPVILVSICIFIAGMYYFLKSDKAVTRIVWLVSSGLLMIIIAIIASSLYWSINPHPALQVIG